MMDLIGLLMGWVTVAMALLSLASLAGGVALLLGGAWQPVAIGLLAFLLCSLLARLLEQIVVSIDDLAARTLASRGRAAAHIVAIVSGGLPIAIILGWEFATFTWFTQGRYQASPVALWLWSYGVATGPWTIFAMRVSRYRRTLCGIRAYAGHLAYWILGLTALGARLPVGATVPAMTLPAVLPFVVGFLLAVADRDALKNVRV